MAFFAARQTGNFSSASTWGEVPSNTMSGNSTFSNQNIDTTARDSAAFSPGAIEIDGIGIYIATRVASPTGTVTVTLRNTSDSVDVVSVTLNQSQVLGRGWLVVSFSAVTLTAGKNYVIRLQSSVSNQLQAYRTNVTSDWHRFLRRTSGSVPGAGDKFFVCGNVTGIDAESAISVTFDNTATTLFGDTTLTSSPFSIAIGHRGTLAFGTAASTNYRLNVRGGVQIGHGGTLTIGTQGTPMPDSSSARIDLDGSANGDSYIEVRGTFIAKGKDKVAWTRLTATATASATVLQVASTSGWEAGDVLLISASESRTAYDTVTVASVDSATQVTLTGGLSFQHQGADGYQSVVCNLTRRIRIISPGTPKGGIYFANDAGLADTTIVQLEGVEFFQLGPAVSWRRFEFQSIGATTERQFWKKVVVNGIRRGISIEATSAAIAMDIEDSIICNIEEVNELRGTDLAVRRTVFHSASANWVIGCRLNTGLLAFEDCVSLGTGASFSNGLRLPSSAGLDWSFISGLEVIGHAQAVMFYSRYSGTIDGFKIWNCDIGLDLASNVSEFDVARYPIATIKNFDACGVAQPIRMMGTYQQLKIEDGFVASSPTTTCLGFIVTGDSNNVGRFFHLVNLVVETAGYRTSLSDFINASTTWPSDFISGIVERCGASGYSVYNSGANVGSATSIDIRVIQGGRQAGDHQRFLRPNGVSIRDTAIKYGASGASQRLTPNSGSVKLQSGPKYVLVSQSGTRTVSCYVRKSVVGDGAAYNGAEPRLIVLKNRNAGIESDTVIATLSGAAGDWLLLSGETPASLYDNNALAVIVDCDGTAGWINIDEWEVS